MYLKSCKYCRKQFEAERKDQVYHSSACKLKAWRTLQGFSLLAELVPEEIVKTKYYVEQHDERCSLYLMWFRQNGNRFADVYVTKNCDKKTLNMLTKKASLGYRFFETVRK
jgi:hypothetical protein